MSDNPYGPPPVVEPSSLKRSPKNDDGRLLVLSDWRLKTTASDCCGHSGCHLSVHHLRISSLLGGGVRLRARCADTAE